MNVSFPLTTVSEVFSGGAWTQAAELRYSTLNGPLRFWFRAMMGRYVGTDLVALHCLENIAFGSTEASRPFVPRLSGTFRKTSAGILRQLSPGYAYLAFPLYEWAGQGQYRLKRECVNPATDFQLSLRFKSPDPLLQNVISATVWLLLNFGAVGSRSRRGFGVIQGKKGPYAPTADIEAHYQDGLKNVDRWFRAFHQRFRDVSARESTATSSGQDMEALDYSSLAHWSACIVARDDIRSLEGWFGYWGVFLRLFRNGETGKIALDDWADITSGSRSAQTLLRSALRERTEDYRNVIADCMDGTDPMPVHLNRNPYLKNDTLGLPIIFQSSTRPGIQRTIAWKREAALEAEETAAATGRRASPLILRPIALPDGRFAALILFFLDHFLPDGAQMPVAYKGRRPLHLSVPGRQDVINTSVKMFEDIAELCHPRANRAGDILVRLSVPGS